jgi:hypothetical protein
MWRALLTQKIIFAPGLILSAIEPDIARADKYAHEKKYNEGAY